MKKYPEKFAIYYFHRPLEAIHPASLPLVKAAIAAELKGYKDVVLKLYDVKVSSREKNVNKILFFGIILILCLLLNLTIKNQKNYIKTKTLAQNQYFYQYCNIPYL